MSSSRTTAAQRRRNGPPDLQGQKGPGTSIQSSSAFAQPPQIRPGTNGRLAGQQASLAQSQQQQLQQQNATSSNGNPKMTVPQAITLITLRLGRLENQMQNVESQEHGEGVNNQLFDHVIQRLETLEQKIMESENTKQQLDLIKPVMANTKTLTANSSKEIKDLKATVDKLKTDMYSLQSIVSCLQTLMTTSETVVEEEIEQGEEEVVEEKNEQLSESTNHVETANLDSINLSENIVLNDLLNGV